jgi:hypothetical protein
MLTRIVGIIALVFAILVIYDVLANQRRMAVGIKILWIVLAVLFSIITGIVYYLVVYKR